MRATATRCWPSGSVFSSSINANLEERRFSCDRIPITSDRALEPFFLSSPFLFGGHEVQFQPQVIARGVTEVLLDSQVELRGLD